MRIEKFTNRLNFDKKCLADIRAEWSENEEGVRNCWDGSWLELSNSNIDEKIEQVLKDLVQNESMRSVLMSAGKQLDPKAKWHWPNSMFKVMNTTFIYPNETYYNLNQ